MIASGRISKDKDKRLGLGIKIREEQMDIHVQERQDELLSKTTEII